MKKQVSLIAGITLIALGILTLAGNLIFQLTGNLFLLGFRTWPLFVIAAGALFCVPPLLFREKRGLSGLFFPGIPVLVTGLLLFLTSVTGNWSLWAVLWPIEVLAVAFSFVLAAIFMRNAWMMVPASIVGINGLVFQFCALTGLWYTWAVLWTVELLAVGLPLLLIGAFQKKEGVKLAGIILCALSGIAFAAASSLIITVNRTVGMIGPLLLLGLGAYLIALPLRKNNVPPTVQVAGPAESPEPQPAPDEDQPAA
jgi:hypothetical protein